jgi:ADP-ribosylglycohydrolase
MDGWLIGAPGLHSRRAPGNTCLSALRGEEMGEMQRPLNNSKGCGGVMRVAPVGLVAKDEAQAFSLGCEAAAITHGHPSGYYSAGCFATIVYHLISGRPLPKAIELALRILERPENDEHEECAEAVRRAMAMWRIGDLNPSPEVIERIGGGWVGEEALAISLYCALAAQDDFTRGRWAPERSLRIGCPSWNCAQRSRRWRATCSGSSRTRTPGGIVTQVRYYH